VNRVAWTDERLDDLANRMDAGFARVDADIRELRAELRAEIGGLRLTLLRVGGGIIVGLVGVIAAIPQPGRLTAGSRAARGVTSPDS
jgi:hypothetical protein